MGCLKSDDGNGCLMKPPYYISIIKERIKGQLWLSQDQFIRGALPMRSARPGQCCSRHGGAAACAAGQSAGAAERGSGSCWAREEFALHQGELPPRRELRREDVRGGGGCGRFVRHGRKQSDGSRGWPNRNRVWGKDMAAQPNFETLVGVLLEHLFFLPMGGQVGSWSSCS